MATDLNTIFSWFEEGDFPTDKQFQETFLSFFHKDEKIPQSAIENFETLLQAIPDPSQLKNILSAIANLEQYTEDIDGNLSALLRGIKVTGSAEEGNLIVTLGDYNNKYTKFKVKIDIDKEELNVSGNGIATSSVHFGDENRGSLSAESLTEGRNWKLPNRSGAIALQEDLNTVSGNNF